MGKESPAVIDLPDPLNIAQKKIDFVVFPEMPDVKVELDPDEVELTGAMFSALLGKRLREFENEKEPSLSEVDVERLVPVKKIEEILWQPPFNIQSFRNEEIIVEDIVDFNTGIERSISHLFSEGVRFPEVFAKLRRLPSFAGIVNDYLQRMGQRPVPTTQTRFVGRLKSSGQKCFQLHLADVVDGELYLTDIFLSNANVPAMSENDAARLGHGVFDEIMKNIEEWAREAGYEKIGLSAAEKWNMNVFNKRGFEIDDTVFGNAARENKVGYPMTKKL